MPKWPICETKVDEYIETYISDFNNQEYKLYHCPNCDLQWQEPLRMIPEIYENEIYESYTLFHLGIGDLPLWCKPFFEKFPFKGNYKLLDIGCGNGIFLYYAKTLGFEVQGIDFDKKMQKQQRIDATWISSIL